MKKRYLLTCLMLLWSAVSFSTTVSVSAAKKTGYHYLVQNGGNVAALGDLQLLYAANTNPANFYVFGNSHCFVIVSGDDAVEPILGYSNSNTFKADHMPAGLANMLDGYSEEITFAINNKLVVSPEIASSWQNLKQNKVVAAAKTTAVTPLLTTTWDQGTYYNELCPADALATSTGGHVPAGPEATVMAQIMKFWNWPVNGTSLHSYSTSPYGFLSADFGAATYNWAAMPNAIGSSNLEIAKVMFHTGVSVDMYYDVGGSGAYVTEMTSPITNCLEYALKTHFNYKSTLHGLARSAYTATAWVSLLKAEVDAGRPVVYDGTGASGGHCFILDGYDATNKFHVNWGWSGASDGYYPITALNPPIVGIGGGSGGFNSNQHAIVGIEPEGLVMASAVTVSAASIPYAHTFNVTATVKNFGSVTFTGSLAAMVYDASGGALTDSVQVLASSLAAGVTSSVLTFTTAGSLAMTPGNYTVSIYAKSAGGIWKRVGNGSFSNSGPVNVYSYIQCGSLMAPSVSPFVQGSPASVDLNFKNDGPLAFSGSYEIDLYNMDGTYNSTIQTLTGMSLASSATYPAPLTFSTSSITALPGTYHLMARYNDGTVDYKCGSNYFPNPISITVVAPIPPPPPLSPDIYEVNNTAATAYTLPLAWVSDVATQATTGSNIHIASDEDYYKIILPAGYNYSITARLNDTFSNDGSGILTVDGIWSYSVDGGAFWSAPIDDVMTGTIDLSGGIGGTVIFHVLPHSIGDTGTYLLKLSNITRTVVPSAIPHIALEAAQVYPTPATDHITIDLTGTGTTSIQARFTDVQGRAVYTADCSNKEIITIPVQLPSGMYIVAISTNAGVITRKIVIDTE